MDVVVAIPWPWEWLKRRSKLVAETSPKGWMSADYSATELI